MPNIPAEIIMQGNDNAFFTTNAAVVYPANIQIFHTDGRYKFTDGVTALSALSFLGGSSTTPSWNDTLNVDNTTYLSPILFDGILSLIESGTNKTVEIRPDSIKVQDNPLNLLFEANTTTGLVQKLGVDLATVNDIPSLAGLAPINSPLFTGTPLAPAPAQYDSTTQIPTTKWVRDNAGGCLYRNITGGTSITGVTTQQLVDGFLLAANTIEAGWDLYNELNVNKNLDNGTVTVRVLYNSTNSLSGATTLATWTSTTANNQVSFMRSFGVISATVTELLFAPTTSSAGDFIATSNTTVTQLNIDWTQPIYILWSIQNSSALDTSVISRNKLWKK
jgi:hypothetical protein